MKQSKTRDADASIRKIIDAAQTLFAEQGYQATTLTQISRFSGLARSTPAYFFENKALLYKRAVQELIEEERNFVNSLEFTGEVTVPVLQELLYRHIDHTFIKPKLTKILIRESLSKTRQDWINDYIPNIFGWSHNYLARAQQTGIIRPDIDTHILWLNAMAMAWLPIITQKTFFKSLNIDVYHSDFIAKHKEQIKIIFFESILPQKR